MISKEFEQLHLGRLADVIDTGDRNLTSNRNIHGINMIFKIRDLMISGKEDMAIPLSIQIWHLKGVLIRE